MYSEKDVTWSSIERYYKYDKVVWYVCDNGIPTYKFMDGDKKINVSLKKI